MSEKSVVVQSGVKARNKNSGLASTAKVFRSETRGHKMMEWSATWMWHSWGTVGWSLFNQGWFKSRAVSSRKQGQRVSSLGWAKIQGFICRKRRMRTRLQSTASFFLLSSFIMSSHFVFSSAVVAQTPPEKTAARVDGRDPRVMNAAKMYERYFLGQMMKAMRSTVTKSELEKPSMGENIYREQLDDQYVESWSERGGIGLADMIHDELMGKAEMLKRRKQALRDARGKTRVPIALTERDVLKNPAVPKEVTSGDGIEAPLGSAVPGELAQSPGAASTMVQVMNDMDKTGEVDGAQTSNDTKAAGL